MFKSTIVAAILATAASFAVAQTTGGAEATSSGVTEGASQNNVGTPGAKMAKHGKSKKAAKSTTSAGMSGSDGTTGSVTGATGTTAAGTPGQSTSGATKPATDGSMTH